MADLKAQVLKALAAMKQPSAALKKQLSALKKPTTQIKAVAKVSKIVGDSKPIADEKKSKVNKVVKEVVINNHIVKPIQQKGSGDLPVRGAEIFPRMYPNIGLFARKNSGKTTVIKDFIETCVTPKTRVIVFCTTLNKDKGWLAIKDMCKEKKIPFEGYTDLGARGPKKSRLSDILGDLREEEPEPEPDKKVIVDEQGNELKMSTVKKIVKPPKPKYAPLDYMFIFDDIGDQIKHATIEQLLKSNRHYKCDTVVSVQHVGDIPPVMRKQIDYWLLFPALSLKSLDLIRVDAGLPLSEDRFADLYHQATSEKYSFLYIDQGEQTFRRKFDKRLEVEHDAD